MKKKTLIIGIAILQICVLGYMAGEREWVLRNGHTLYLRTAPIDPRDMMRGDYVRLNYSISRVPGALCLGSLAFTNNVSQKLPRDTKVYAALKVSDGDVAELVSLSPNPPATGLFVRGRTERSWGSLLQVRYGLEAYFMEQGKGLELEKGRNREGIQVPLEMEVAVSPGGLGVLKGHRWCALGLGLDLETLTNARTPNVRFTPGRVIGAKLRLLNASSNDVAIVDLPDGRSFSLLSDSQWGDNPWQGVNEKEIQGAPEQSQVIVLKPGQIHTMNIAFNSPRWSITKKEDGNPITTTLADIRGNGSARFRLEYRPPDQKACAQLTNAGIIWHGRLPSQVFTPFGSVD